MTRRKSVGDLTDKRQKLIKAIAAMVGNEQFTRRELNEVLEENDLSSIIGEPDKPGAKTLQTTTGLLTKIAEEDNWLDKPVQGGESPFVIDYGADEDKGEMVTGVTASDLSKMASQVLDRNGVSGGLGDVNYSDWGDVVTSVNGAVSKAAMGINAEPNEYKLPEDAIDDLDGS
jgi:hypothetical protein